jgi:CheY-like chemotaxis protein
LEYQFADTLPPIEADPSQIRQAVMNLVINASEAIGDRGGSIRIETGLGDMMNDPTFHSYFSQDTPKGPSVFLRVQDDGCGMDEETLKRIFDPFFTTKCTGRGLGLASILGIVRGHKGSMQVKSRPNHGTTFCLYFPASFKPILNSTPMEDQSVSVRGEGVILVVDDEPSVRKLISETLESLGFTVLQAPNGQKGLALFQENMNKILAVFLDLDMPVMGGEETYKAIQQLQPGTPTILMSGYDEQTTQRLAGLEGIVAIFQKPFHLRRLSNILQSVLAKVQNAPAD